jgi:hypothetical protein
LTISRLRNALFFKVFWVTIRADLITSLYLLETKVFLDAKAPSEIIQFLRQQ